MGRKANFIAMLATGLLLLARPSQAADGFLDLYRAAETARQAGDLGQAQASLAKALVLRPVHPAALYRLAGVRALDGNAEGALELLQQLAAMRLSHDPAKDPAFAPLSENTRFIAVTRQFEANRRPVGNAVDAFRVFELEAIPEGIAHDRETLTYYLGAAHLRRIFRTGRTSAGGAQDFVRTSSGGLMSPLGMVVDQRRDLLWVAHAGLRETMNLDPEDLGRTGLLAYDLASGRPKRRKLLPDDGNPHEFRHLELMRNGELYLSDSTGGQLYHFGSRGQFKPVTEPGALITPRGLALDEDRERLFVADRARGLYAFNPADGTLQRLEVAENISVYGLDDIDLHDGDLIAVQNGVLPHRIVRYRLDKAGRRVESAVVLAANLPSFDTPGQGEVVRNAYVFIANSQWNRIGKDGVPGPRDDLRSPVAMRLYFD